ncbi:MAG: multicopper oxidase domain-containing protein [Deltaproteobacteria bacterium]|nr:multicopper oxidase domain-containing protein [Deltaproteobacteria bacterium]
MSLTRREFLRFSATAALALHLPGGWDEDSPVCSRYPSGTVRGISASLGAPLNPPALDPTKLEAFVDPLPVPPVARSNGVRLSPDGSSRKLPFYQIEMREVLSKVHRDLPPTRLWGFQGVVPGPTFETRKGDELLVEWVNRLPARHFLPIDHRLHGAERDKPEVRTVVHLHGGRTPPSSDGYPEDWYPPGKSATYFYPNRQDAATLWYHDHAMGINRLNIYAGLSGLFIIRDQVEDKLHLPRGRYEIPLVIFDRMLDAHGQLLYPVSGDPRAPWLADFFGNVMMVNGRVAPFLEVEPRKYRFRVLNGSNSRLYHLQLANGMPMMQIGSDQGLLASPAELQRLAIAPAERADLVVDFAGHQGERIVLKDDAVDVMQFRVSRVRVVDDSHLPHLLRSVPRIPEAGAVRTRTLTLNEYNDRTGQTILMLLNGTYWHQPITEKPRIDSTEIWNLVNLTDEVHPIHLHLVRFQVLDRRVFERFEYQRTGNLRYLGPVTPPEQNEMGWKDTVRAQPHAVTRIIARFEGYKGRYVWHCHNLEHEDNEMMRPYEVI